MSIPLKSIYIDLGVNLTGVTKVTAFRMFIKIYVGYGKWNFWNLGD